MTITLEGCPPSLNAFAGRSNTWQYRKEKAKWTHMVESIGEMIAPPRPYEKAKIIITYYFPTNARHDADNYAGKFLLDGLTKAGIIVDDDLKHITTEIRGEVDKTNPRTVIKIFDL